MSEEQPSRELILQRVRNRIIEYLEIASSFEAQRCYQADVPTADVPAEMICMWEDHVNEDTIADFGPPVFSPQESEAIRGFDATLSTVLTRMPDPTPALEAVLSLGWWESLRQAAEDTLRVFAVRGKLPEDREIW